MHIVVCIKRVVDTETRVKIDDTGKAIALDGVQFIMAPYDEMAVEKAIQLRDAAGEGKVTVVTMGPAGATKELRTALAMGADEAIHKVTESSAGPLATAKVLRDAVKDLGADVILCGKQATDVDDAAVGPMLAALLNLPCVAFVDALTVEGGKANVEREIDGLRESLTVTLPAVFTAQKGLAEARYPGLKGIMAAKKKPLMAEDVTPESGKSSLRSLTLPPSRGAMVTIEPTADGMNDLLQKLRNDKKVI